MVLIKRGKLAFAAAVFGMVAAAAGDSANVVLKPGAFDVVVEDGVYAGKEVVRFAAEEMTNFLSRALGQEVQIRTFARPGIPAIVLGNSPSARKAGIDVGSLPHDGFAIKCVPPDRIYISGLDDEKFIPGKSRHVRRGTLFGAYNFLERHAGCRFYFPGELGEIVPRSAELKVPAGETRRHPAFVVRQMPNRLGKWFADVSDAERERLELLFYYRVGAQTMYIPCCHGQVQMKFPERFGKSHPEYFLLNKDGTRFTRSTVAGKDTTRVGQMCHSSGIWDEIYEDAKAYFQGRSASSRGIPGGVWGSNARYGKYFDVMPQDGMVRCFCGKCQAAYARAKYKDDWANELVWGRVCDIAERLRKDGIDGNLTMMSYVNYRRLPERPVPPNVSVMVCSNDPWLHPDDAEKTFDNLKRWSSDRDGKVWLWNNNGKHSWYSLDIDGVPTPTPRAFGRYYKKCAPYIFGAYASNCSERFLYSALNYYVFCKVAWDPSVDADALIDEYYELMFGPAAGMMRLVFDGLERIWLTEVIGKAYEIKYGTAVDVPRNFSIWTKIYTPERIRPFETLFDAAAQSVAPGSVEARRIALMRKEVLAPLVDRSRRYATRVSAAGELKRRSRRKVETILPSFEPGAITVETSETNRPFKAVKYPVSLKPGRTYRLSFLARGRDIVRFPGVRRYGAQAVIWSDQSADKVLAETEMTEGTFGWVHLSADFTVPADAGERFRPELDIRIFRATGMFEFRDLVLEDLPPGELAVLTELEEYPVACREVDVLKGEAPSLLPEGRKFKLVWNDEFNGDRLDESKWGYRTNFWGRPAHWFAKPEDGCVEVKDGKAHLRVKKRPDGQFVSPQLQTGEIVWDVPESGDNNTFWPLVKREPAKFTHRYGYYECRCRLQQLPGWWSAFWMQTESQGSTLDPERSGIEHDIMESFDPGVVHASCFHYNGYGDDHKHFKIPEDRNGLETRMRLDKTKFHVFGMLWDEKGYSIYVDGRLKGTATNAVSRVPEFVLLTTEAKWYRARRMTGSAVPELEDVVKNNDDFVVDYVRVYDIEE